MKALGIAFSARKNGNCAKLLQYCLDNLKKTRLWEWTNRSLWLSDHTAQPLQLWVLLWKVPHWRRCSPALRKGHKSRCLNLCCTDLWRACFSSLQSFLRERTGSFQDLWRMERLCKEAKLHRRGELVFRWGHGTSWGSPWDCHIGLLARSNSDIFKWIPEKLN